MRDFSREILRAIIPALRQAHHQIPQGDYRMNNRIRIEPKHKMTVPQAPYRPPQTWENIFNSNHLDVARLSEVVRLARDSGYPYYLWNLAVWATPATGTASDRVCLQEEIQKG